VCMVASRGACLFVLSSQTFHFTPLPVADSDGPPSRLTADATSHSTITYVTNAQLNNPLIRLLRASVLSVSRFPLSLRAQFSPHADTDNAESTRSAGWRPLRAGRTPINIDAARGRLARTPRPLQRLYPKKPTAAAQCRPKKTVFGHPGARVFDAPTRPHSLAAAEGNARSAHRRLSQELTSGVNMYSMPLNAPSSITERTRKIVVTK
jgi:hypothetical protein